MDDVTSDKSNPSLVDKKDGHDFGNQCQFFLPKKSRLCRFRPKTGEKYCPEHACVMGIQGIRKRIPCPLNPKHNCYEDELEKHKKKCNVTKIQHNVERAVYYVKGINSGSNSSLRSSSATSSKHQTCVKDLSSENLAHMIERVEKLYNAHVENMRTIRYLHPCVEEEFNTSGEGDLDTVLHDQPALRKELAQQAALIGQMAEEDFFQSTKSCFIELGAGKGKLSHWIHKASKQASNKFLLVERGSVRYKMDGYLKQDKGEASFKRIKMDIEDLHLGKVPEINADDIIFVVGKHLCGGATDMGLRCAVNTLIFQDHADVSTNGSQSKTTVQERSSSGRENPIGHNPLKENVGDAPPEIHTNTVSSKSENDPSTEIVGDSQRELWTQTASLGSGTSNTQSSGLDVLREPPTKIQRTEASSNSRRNPQGIMIALCCHHRCTWDSYVGQTFMQECGISPEEFDLLTRLSSWATCARNTSRANPKTGTDQVNVSLTALEKDEEEADKSDNAHSVKDLISFTNSSNQTFREQLRVPERERIGRMCKRLIDTGRLHYLRSKGMTAFLTEYIDEITTPENVVLLAKMKDP